MEESPSEPRVKRQRVDKAGRFAALERLKQLKGSKNKYEITEDVDNVYEIVDEREYAKKAKQLYGDDWIEDDGTGYAEDGRDFFEDEDEYSDDDSVRSSKRNKNKESKKRPRDIEKPAKGKGSIRNLFSNAVPKKSTATSIKDDDILADILGELQDKPTEAASSTASTGNDKPHKVIAPARIVNKSSKKSDAAVAKEYMNSFMNNIKLKDAAIKAKENSDDELLDSILYSKPNGNPKASVPNCTETLKEIENNNKNSVSSATTVEKSAEVVATNCSEKHEIPNDDMDFSCFQDDENQFEMEKSLSTASTINNNKSPVRHPCNAAKKPPIDQEDDLQHLLSNWENICQMDNFEQELVASTALSSDVNGANCTENLRFWYWEAWEDPLRRPGEVFLFGRTADGKSICVRVEKIDRVVYLLPREYVSCNIYKHPVF